MIYHNELIMSRRMNSNDKKSNQSFEEVLIRLNTWCCENKRTFKRQNGIDLYTKVYYHFTHLSSLSNEDDKLWRINKIKQYPFVMQFCYLFKDLVKQYEESHKQIIVPIVEPKVIPIIVPIVEPKVIPIVVPIVEPKVEPIIEPIIEQIIEPIIEPKIVLLYMPTSDDIKFESKTLVQLNNFYKRRLREIHVKDNKKLRDEMHKYYNNIPLFTNNNRILWCVARITEFPLVMTFCYPFRELVIRYTEQLKEKGINPILPSMKDTRITIGNLYLFLVEDNVFKFGKTKESRQKERQKEHSKKHGKQINFLCCEMTTGYEQKEYILKRKLLTTNGITSAHEYGYEYVRGTYDVIKKVFDEVIALN